MTLEEHLAEIGACHSARVWAYPRTARNTWLDCSSVCWLLWWAARTPVNGKEEIVRYAITWSTAAGSVPEPAWGKHIPAFDMNAPNRITAEIAALYAATSVAAGAGPEAADMWDEASRKAESLWEALARDAWVLAVNTRGNDYCVQARACFRQPWIESQ